MLAFGADPISIDPATATDPRDAFEALAGAAATYLDRLDQAVADRRLPAHAALITRVRGTGPGVSFGRLVAAVESGFSPRWSSPFEGSDNVSGAAVTVEGRTDGFLFLRFAPQTRNLTLHTHPHSDRFIFAIGGRGFFHIARGANVPSSHRELRHVPVRDRDALMFRRGVVHTFSTAEHALTLLSYHRPFVPLDDEDQYVPTVPPLLPSTFLDGVTGKVSFDAAWTCLS